MSDDREHQDNALVFTARQLPATTALVNRGVALAERLLADTSTDQRRTIAETCLREARHHLERVFLLWESRADEDRNNLRLDFFRTYHWGLVAATTILRLPWTGVNANSCDDPGNHMRLADQLLDEPRLNIDIEPYLCIVGSSRLKGDRRWRKKAVRNVETFLDKVTALLDSPLTEPPSRHRGGVVGVTLPELSDVSPVTKDVSTSIKRRDPVFFAAEGGFEDLHEYIARLQGSTDWVFVVVTWKGTDYFLHLCKAGLDFPSYVTNVYESLCRTEVYPKGAGDALELHIVTHSRETDFRLACRALGLTVCDNGSVEMHRRRVRFLSATVPDSPAEVAFLTQELFRRIRSTPSTATLEIEWWVELSDDPVRFLTSALSPANVQRVSIMDYGGWRYVRNVIEVVVEDKQLSLAIGKKAQNARLAAGLTGWKIDIKSEEEKRREVET